LETRSASGGTALDRLLATTAAQRLGLTPTVAPLDRTSFHGEGRSTRAAAPATHGRPLTRGSSREHRPDVTQVLRDRRVAPQAGLPLLRPPLSGPTRDALDVRPLVPAPMAPRPLTDGPADLVADRARSQAENRQPLAPTPSPWSTRVPATVSGARVAPAAAAPDTLEPLVEGSRSHR
jgi:hypothetical protein